MAKNPKRFIGLVFILGAALFEVAALLPMIGGRPPNVVFLSVGVVFLVLGLARLKAAKAMPEDPAT